MTNALAVIVGKPNVGKSTLFNRLSKTRNALVSEVSGLTRDRQYANINLENGTSFTIVDTGGLTGYENLVDDAIKSQVSKALLAADFILFLVSAKEELTTIDYSIALRLRKFKKPILFLCNKSENLVKNELYKFYELGLGEPLAISAEHNIGITELFVSITKCLTNNKIINHPKRRGTLRR